MQKFFAATRRAAPPKFILHLPAITILLFAWLLVVQPAFAESCDDDTIQSKSDDGSYLIMESGAVYEVLAGDQIDSALWTDLDDVVICEQATVVGGRTVLYYQIVNKDEDEKVDAVKRH
jgi:hypothetical protein